MKTLITMILLVGLVAFVACGDDDPVDNGDPSPEYANLSQKQHVLNNIELAYNRRNIEKYDELLDENFTFFLSAGDVGGGLPAQWDRAVEVSANMHLFTSDEGYPRCTDIEMDVQWEDGVTWAEVPAFGGETWYTTTVFYSFEFKMDPNYTWLSNPGAKAQFTVRNAGTEEAPRWQLVEMHDLGDPELVAGTASGTQQITWGEIKAMYR